MTKQQKQQKQFNEYYTKANRQEKELLEAVHRLTNSDTVENVENNLAEINELVAYLNNALNNAKNVK